MIPIPLKDNLRRETWPVITLVLVGLNLGVFLFELSLGNRLEQLIQVFSVVPARYTGVEGWSAQGIVGLIVSLFSSMFLHAGWGHLLSNMLFLWVFGRSVEDRFEHRKFLGLYLICGIGAAFTHIYINPLSEIPTVGASGAIAGVLGAYLLSYPAARITTLVPLFILFWSIEVPAFLILGYWFLIQFVAGWQAFMIAPSAVGGVAWWAHIGGFITGFLLAIGLRPRRKKPTPAWLW